MDKIQIVVLTQFQTNMHLRVGIMGQLVEKFKTLVGDLPTSLYVQRSLGISLVQCNYQSRVVEQHVGWGLEWTD